MLRFDLQVIREGGLTLEERVAGDDQAFEGLDLHLVGPVLVTGRLSATPHGGVLWRGRVAGVARGECRRCLALVDSPFGVEVEAVFLPSAEAAGDAAVFSLPEARGEVDLTEAVREEVGLAVPAYPLCRESCAGLCPRCGENRNEGPCACARSPEPR
jgi:uncharacterized protein